MNSFPTIWHILIQNLPAFSKASLVSEEQQDMFWEGQMASTFLAIRYHSLSICKPQEAIKASAELGYALAGQIARSRVFE